MRVLMSGDPANPLRLLIAAAFVLMCTMYTTFHGIGAPRRRMQRHALHLLHHAHYDDRTLTHIERMARIGKDIPWMSYQTAILAAIADYRQEHN